MLRHQLELAKAEKHSVKVCRDIGYGMGKFGQLTDDSEQKVILVGGFGQSPSLQSYLREVVATERSYLDQPIEFLTPAIP